ncbi:hypothetical protein SZN_22141 [Streptomyces zinciresistens K42]|uniref:Uncharacterized protein n=1 Tax=Streptomyces zinciresistens K42 TaxID=700597 RepID=G2GFZ4_9ACTN|nr:hypothetical protein [Streptomyces zinciresistens]EGX57573.1 hypothetical protein SZN_22141 [Streptomyces zinciresistens K42]
MTRSERNLTGCPPPAPADSAPPPPSATTRQAYAIGGYCYFNANPGVAAQRAFEAPNRPGARFTGRVTVSPDGAGTIRNAVNNTGGPSDSSTTVADLPGHP